MACTWGLAAGYRASAAALGLPSSSFSSCVRRQQCAGATYRHAGEWGWGYGSSISCCGSSKCTVMSRVLRRGEQGWVGRERNDRLRPQHLQPPLNAFMQQHPLNNPLRAPSPSARRQPTGASSSKRQRLGVLVQAATVEPKVMLANGLVDFYEVLGVDDDATMDEIKKAYRTLAKEVHWVRSERTGAGEGKGDKKGLQDPGQGGTQGRTGWGRGQGKGSAKTAWEPARFAEGLGHCCVAACATRGVCQNRVLGAGPQLLTPPAACLLLVPCSVTLTTWVMRDTTSAFC